MTTHCALGDYPAHDGSKGVGEAVCAHWHSNVLITCLSCKYRQTDSLVLCRGGGREENLSRSCRVSRSGRAQTPNTPGWLEEGDVGVESARGKLRRT